MAYSGVLDVASSHLLLVALGIACLFLLRNYFNNGLHKIPGPFWARFTNLWRAYDVHKGQHHLTVVDLHRKYGPYVRLGPNYISIADPKAIKDIYGLNKGFEKSAFYDVFRASKGGRSIHTIFSDRSEHHHAATKKPVSNSYSMTTLTEYEPFVDNTIRVMLRRLNEEFCQPGETTKPCDMAAWLEYYAFDVVAELTYSHRLGFLDQGRDVDNMILKLKERQDYNAPIGQIPWLDYILKKNPLFKQWSNAPDMFTGFASSMVQKRQSGEDGFTNERKDFMSRFIAAKKTHANIVDDSQVVAYTLNNVLAGSDTTAISLRSMLYFILKNPGVHKKLRDEVDRIGDLKSEPGVVGFKQAQSLPYLDAVIKETFRVFPAVGLGLERTVPASGLTLPDGTFIPGGTIVGMNAWPVHRDEAVFGPNTDDFDPSRWLPRLEESEEDYKLRVDNMNRANLVFGSGSRTCIGKNVSLLEIYKLIPTLFGRFEMELAEPEKEWTTENKWFVRQSNIMVNLEKRTPS